MHTRRIGFLSEPDALPAEIVIDILECLPTNELWPAARVSRQFYAAAWRAGLLINLEMRWTPTDDFLATLAASKDVLEHVKGAHLRLSLTVQSLLPSDDTPNAHIYAAIQPVADALSALISAALPFLVHLSIRVPDRFRPQFVSALRSPAPKLLTFELNRVEYAIPCPVPLPCDLFAGSAPQLHTVKLDAVTLPDYPISAFRSVCQALITHQNVLPHLEIANHFPGLTGLHLKFIEWGDGETVLPDRFDYLTLGLRALVIEDMANYWATPLLNAVMRCVNLSTIPVVDVKGRIIPWDERLWPADPAALSVRISFSGDDARAFLRVISVPVHGRWRRLYNFFPWEMDTALPISGLPDLSARLVYLRIDGMLLANLLELKLPFPALRNLRIDMQARFHGHISLALKDYHWTLPSHLQSVDPAAPGSASHVSAPCPVLEVITLFALDAPITRATSRRAGLLAHALGQAQRPKHQRAALALVGYEFDQPVEHALLDQTVSQIRTHAFAGLGSCEDYDEGLWEPALSVIS